jgi:pterin-4a-carbinolamine dehydratase
MEGVWKMAGKTDHHPQIDLHENNISFKNQFSTKIQYATVTVLPMR